MLKTHFRRDQNRKCVDSQSLVHKLYIALFFLLWDVLQCHPKAPFRRHKKVRSKVRSRVHSRVRSRGFFFPEFDLNTDFYLGTNSGMDSGMNFFLCRLNCALKGNSQCERLLKNGKINLLGNLVFLTVKFIVRRNLDDIKKFVPEFIPQFVPA